MILQLLDNRVLGLQTVVQLPYLLLSLKVLFHLLLEGIISIDCWLELRDIITSLIHFDVFLDQDVVVVELVKFHLESIGGVGLEFELLRLDEQLLLEFLEF